MMSGLSQPPQFNKYGFHFPRREYRQIKASIMDDLAVLESKIQSLKAVFSSPVPLERSWVSQGDESRGNSPTTDTSSIDKLSSTTTNRSDVAEKQSQKNNESHSAIRVSNEDSSLILSRVEHQATVIRDKMKVIKMLKEKIEKNKAAYKDQVNKMEEAHAMELQAIVATLDEARANLVNQRDATRKERKKAKQWETKYTKLHNNMISLHESVKKAQAEVEAERNAYITELEVTKSKLIETQQKLSRCDSELIEFRSQNANKNSIAPKRRRTPPIWAIFNSVT